MAEKSKIFIFSTAYLPMIGGAELAIKEITDRLADDFDFVLFTARFKRSYPKHENIGRVEVYRLGFGLQFDKYILPILGYIKAKQIIKKLKIENWELKILLWGMMSSFGSIAAYFLKKKFPEIPFLLTLQEGDPEEYLLSGRRGLMGFWLQRLVKKADFIQTISQYLKKLAIKAGKEPAKIEVVPNGVDLNVFSQKFDRSHLQELKIKLGLPEGKPVIITASRLVHKNAVDVLIRAMADIPSAHLLIAGTGPQEKELSQLAKNLKKERMIHFLGNIVHKDLTELFAISHVFVRPSRSEGLGSAFLEAMAAGLPVVATNVGGIPDFLEHEKTGLFCEVDNPEDLAFKIKRFLNSEGFRKTIGLNGQKLVFENYSWDKIALKLGGIFYRLIHSK